MSRQSSRSRHFNTLQSKAARAGTSKRDLAAVARESDYLRILMHIFRVLRAAQDDRTRVGRNVHNTDSRFGLQRTKKKPAVAGGLCNWVDRVATTATHRFRRRATSP